MRLTRLLLVAALVATLSVLLPNQSQAHDPVTWYFGTWDTPDAPNIDFQWADHDFDGMVGTNRRSVIANGADEWSDLPPNLQFAEDGFDYTLEWDSCNDLGDNPIFWMPIPGEPEIVGETQLCFYVVPPTQIANFQMRFDSDESWYVGTGTPGSTQVDLWSVSAHEFGHAAGHGLHWDDFGFLGGNGNCWPLVTVDRHHTMCRFIFIGTNDSRSLELHDSHTFENAY